jgi:hypothetical protein
VKFTCRRQAQSLQTRIRRILYCNHVVKKTKRTSSVTVTTILILTTSTVTTKITAGRLQDITIYLPTLRCDTIPYAVGNGSPSVSHGLPAATFLIYVFIHSFIPQSLTTVP